MHGLMVDVLADGKALLYARARHYDPEHGRWLQRDPLGFIDGPNLYEAFGGNTLVHADPLGLRYKIASSWENGAEVFWQDIDWFTWSMAGKPVNDFSLGRYYCIEGQKLVVYKGPLSSIRDFREATHYVLSLDAVEELGRQKLDWDTYEKLLYVHADAFRVGYDGLIEQLGSPAGIWVHQLAVDLSLQAQAHNRQVMNSLGSIGTRRLGMLLSGGVDPVTESNMTGREIAVEIGLTAVEVALILGPAVVPEMEMAATARSAARERFAAASGRTTAVVGAESSAVGVRINRAAGDAAADLIAIREAGFREGYFETVGGIRKPDVIVPGESILSIESKVGRTALDSRIRQELARDWWLRRQGQVDRVIWEFFPNEVGEVGPTAPLLRKLRKLEFDVKINR